eukprot:120053_1
MANLVFWNLRIILFVLSLSCRGSFGFNCNDGVFISDDLLCDGKNDCSDGEDESSCNGVCPISINGGILTVPAASLDLKGRVVPKSVASLQCETVREFYLRKTDGSVDGSAGAQGSVVCAEDGNWSGDACQRGCSINEPITNGSFTNCTGTLSNNLVVLSGLTCQVHCNDGFEFQSGGGQAKSGTQAQLVCSSEAGWTGGECAKTSTHSVAWAFALCILLVGIALLAYRACLHFRHGSLYRWDEVLSADEAPQLDVSEAGYAEMGAAPFRAAEEESGLR